MYAKTRENKQKRCKNMLKTGKKPKSNLFNEFNITFNAVSVCQAVFIAALKEPKADEYTIKRQQQQTAATILHSSSLPKQVQPQATAPPVRINPAPSTLRVRVCDYSYYILRYLFISNVFFFKFFVCC